MAFKITDLKDGVKNALNMTTAKAADALDVNGDGAVDIQDILILALKTPGVRVDRAGFLRKELFKNHTEQEVENVIAHTPALAGIGAAEIERIADETIRFERNCVSGISAALGAPGGVAMAATVPADIVQYYACMLRAAQKLLYLYGFPELRQEGEGISLDSETVNVVMMCLGVMSGVAGANSAIKALASALARGVEKKLLAKALTKGTLYPMLKAILKWFGVNLTKKMLATAAKNAIPVAGGVVGGAVTFFSFKPCCKRLQDSLRDTLLADPDHVASEEEREMYEGIVSDEEA